MFLRARKWRPQIPRRPTERATVPTLKSGAGAAAKTAATAGGSKDAAVFIAAPAARAAAAVYARQTKQIAAGATGIADRVPAKAPSAFPTRYVVGCPTLRDVPAEIDAVYGQGSTVLENRAANSGRAATQVVGAAALGEPVLQSQSTDRNRPSADKEQARCAAAVDGQDSRARTLDVQAVVDSQSPVEAVRH